VDTLRAAYDELRTFLPAVEPFAAVQRAEAHRMFWRPETVRVVLLAESHVFTSAAELERRIVRLPATPPGIPDGYIRLVYCLGYGENGILDRRIDKPDNDGTWQFWRLFASCLDGPPRSPDFRSTYGSGVPDHVRVANKVALLMRLRDAGVWLLDASPAALYTPGGAKPGSRMIDRAVDAGYELHVRHALEAADPVAVICVGIGVGAVLSSRLRRTGAVVTVIPAPQAHKDAATHEAALATCQSTVRAALESSGGPRSPRP
jgi:hypothetical protein